MRLLSLLSLFLLGRAFALPLEARPVSDVEVPAIRRAYLDDLAKRGPNPLNNLLSLIVTLFPVNVAVSEIANVISIAEQALATALKIDTTENGIAGDASGGATCAGMTIVFARGTTEAGNVGAIVGPPFFNAVRTRLGKYATLAVQGVEYPADIPGFLAGGSAAGSQKMADDVNQVLAACPNSKVVMSGFSQGGQVVHNAAKLLPADAMARVSSVVIFGDPNNGQAVAGISPTKTLVICHAGDNICAQGDLILLPHLTYAENADQAAAFVVANAGAIGA